MYIHDTFYKTEHLSIEDKKNLLLDAKAKSFRWWIDKHDDRKVRRRIK